MIPHPHLPLYHFHHHHPTICTPATCDITTPTHTCREQKDRDRFCTLCRWIVGVGWWGTGWDFAGVCRSLSSCRRPGPKHISVMLCMCLSLFLLFISLVETCWVDIGHFAFKTYLIIILHSNSFPHCFVPKFSQFGGDGWVLCLF